MHLFVLGGSGRTGQLLIEEALSKGHTVTALTRDSSKIESGDGLTIFKGTPNEQSDIDASFTSGGTPAAILVTLSATASDNPFAAPIAPPDTLERSNRNVITAMKAHGVRKIVIMHAQGVGDSYPEASFLTRLLASKTQMRHQFKDHGNTDKLVRAEAHGGALRWTMVRPPMLKGMEKLPVKDMGDQSKGAGLIPSCSRGSAA